MVNQPKFSIVTACYNAEEFIEETIESVLNQRGRFNIEYIVIDGDSSDRTLSKIERYRRQVDDGTYPIRCSDVEMIVVSEPDRGMYDALAKGFRIASGDIVSYLNADDYYLPNCLSAVSKSFEMRPETRWATGLSTWFNVFGHVFHSNLPPRYDQDFIRRGVYGNYLPHIQQECTFWRSELLEQIEYDRFASFKSAGDFYLWYSFAAECNLEVINAQLGGFRVRPGQKSDDKALYQKEFDSITRTRLNAVERIRVRYLKFCWRFPILWKLKLFPGYIGLHAPTGVNMRLSEND